MSNMSNTSNTYTKNGGVSGVMSQRVDGSLWRESIGRETCVLLGAK